MNKRLACLALIVLILVSSLIGVFGGDYVIDPGERVSITIVDLNHLNVSNIIFDVSNDSPLTISARACSDCVCDSCDVCPAVTNLSYNYDFSINYSSDLLQVLEGSIPKLTVSVPGTYQFRRVFECPYIINSSINPITQSCNDLMQNASSDSVIWWAKNLINSYEKVNNYSNFNVELYQQLLTAQDLQNSYASQKQACEQMKGEYYDELKYCNNDKTNLSLTCVRELQICKISNDVDSRFYQGIITMIIVFAIIAAALALGYGYYVKFVRVG